jgi:hypothetical protein
MMIPYLCSVIMNPAVPLWSISDIISAGLDPAKIILPVVTAEIVLPNEQKF